LGAKGEVTAKIVSSSLAVCVCVFLRKYKRDCERGQRKKKRGCKVAAPTIITCIDKYNKLGEENLKCSDI
jgi:hypothetical protein